MLNKEIFIVRSNMKHNNKYDYSLTEYKNNRTKVKIICPDHGEFEQKPSKHMIGQGCPKCVGKNKNNDDFIKNAINIHGNIYDYSLVKYIKAENKIKIICKEHGIFEQTPHNHLSGNRCPKCFGGVKYSEEYFIEKSKEIHKEKYDYNQVNYINWNKPVKILCRKHGIFEQTPNNHLMGHGCKECSNDLYRTDLEEFKNKCHKIHNNKYNYNNIFFKSTKDKIKIICPEHGEFEQLASVHSSGGGCKLCFENRMKLDKKEFIERSNKVHNNSFDYSLVEYINNYTPVKIICKKHGIFEQIPISHLKGVRCPFCVQEIRDRIPAFMSYSRKVNNITTKNIKNLIINWSGMDYYDNEYIKEYLSYHYNDKKYPTIDHKISKHFGFLNNISPEEIGDINNLCITKRSLNSMKNKKNHYDFQKIIQNTCQ